jgi:hypothetical protein
MESILRPLLDQHTPAAVVYSDNTSLHKTIQKQDLYPLVKVRRTSQDLLPIRQNQWNLHFALYWINTLLLQWSTRIPLASTVSLNNLTCLVSALG